jgi:hypothetical protein
MLLTTACDPPALAGSVASSQEVLTQTSRPARPSQPLGAGEIRHRSAIPVAPRMRYAGLGIRNPAH